MTASAWHQVTIVGMGLIGGSIAMALREQHPKLSILAVDRCVPQPSDPAWHVASEWLTPEAASAERSRIASSDLVVLCQPVRAITESLLHYVADAVAVTDTGSTKRHITRRADELEGSSWFVPSHPMAGKEVGGLANATSELFRGRPWILCPYGRSPEAVLRVESLIESVGAKRVVMTVEEHDAAVAVTSHLPQLFASFLQTVGTERGVLGAAGPAFADMTRVAGGSEGIWRDIFETNADEVGRVLQDCALALAALSDALLATPPRVDRVLQVLDSARKSRLPR